MTNNQEKLLRGKLTKWLEARGETPEKIDQKTNAWLQYFAGIKKPVVMLAACTWLCSGAVILPEDMPKVEQAVRVAEINKVDPLRFDRPMSVMEAFPSTELREAPIDPDTVPTLHLARRFDSGLAIYDVDESQESRENMRKIINTHFGKDSSPWCLLQGDGEGHLTENSLQYWNRYNAYPKQVAFVGGKLTAFSANNRNEKVWWDRTDSARKGVSVAGAPRVIKGDPLGRSAIYVYDTETGIPWYENIVRRHDDVLVERYANIESKDYTLDILVDEKKRKEVKTVVLPDSVTEIGRGAFVGCSSLQEIHIPDGVTEIGWEAFAGCSSLQEIHIPDGVTEIRGKAFVGCFSLQEIHIPDGVTEIGWDAFAGCSSLREIHIPDGVTKIGPGAFKECSSLREIHVPDGVAKIEGGAFKGCSSLQEIHIPDGVTEIGRGAFKGCSSLQEIHIPDGVTEIGWDAFAGCSSLREIHIPDGVTEIGWDAFAGCSSLREIHIPDGVTKIGWEAFKGCSSLREIHIPDGVTKIEEGTFWGCSSLREIHIPDGVTEIRGGQFNGGAFCGCSSLQEIRIPDGVTRIGRYAFEGCFSLQEIHIPDSVTEIEWGTFCGCSSLREIHIPDGVTKIWGRAFNGCSSLQEIHIPDSVTEIEEDTFCGCSSLREIHIPNGVTKIGWEAFKGCSSLQEIHIPNGVTKIGWEAFKGCSSLQEIHIPDSVTELGLSVFVGCSSLKEIHVSPTASQSLLDRLREVVPDDCAIVRALPEKDLSALRERGVSEAAIRELQEKGSVHIHEKTFYRPSTEVSPCPDSARTVFTNVVAVVENGTVRMKDPKSRVDLGDAKSFFFNRKHHTAITGIQHGLSAAEKVKHKI